MSQPLVLAIEPDLRQAAIVKRVVREKTQADVVVVETRDAAMEAIRTTMPDVLLLSALMSPRDEEDLMTHLRTLDNAGHLQTHTIPQLASALGPAERSMARGLFSAFRRKKEQEPAAVGGCDPDLFAEEIRVFLQRAADRKRELVNAGPSIAAVRARSTSADAKKAASSSSDDSDGSATASSWESPFEWKPTASRKAPAPRPEPVPAPPPTPMAFDPAAVEPLAPEPLFTEPAHSAPEPALSEPAFATSEPAFAEPAYSASEPALEEPAYSASEPAFAEPVIEEPAPAGAVPDDLPLIVRPAEEEPPVVSMPIIPEPSGISEPLIASEPMFPPEPSIDPQPANARASAPAPVDPWVVHSPRIVTIDPVIEPEPVVAAEPLIDVERVIEVVSEAPSYGDARPVVRATESGAVSIDLDALPEEETVPAPVSAVHERAVKIVARVQDERPADGDSEWTRPQPVRVTDRLGPLARWARSEPKKAKTAAVTADDVRALLASLAVPAAVANVRYPQGCRIRRVRVPAGSDSDASESVGAVILSRRALAEQRSASQ